MKSNTSYLFGALFAAGCFVTSLLWESDGKRAQVAANLTTKSTTVSVASVSDQQEIPTAESPKQSAKRVPPLELISGKNLGANGAIAKFAFLHPEFGLSEQAIADLQRIFLRHYKEYTTFAGKIALARKQDDGSVWIQIPAAPFHVKILQDEFLEEVDAYYGGRAEPKLRSALASLFRGFSNAAGTMAVDMIVRASENPNYAYSIERRLTFLEDNKIVGTGRADDVLTLSQSAESPYAEIALHFPPPRR